MLMLRIRIIVSMHGVMIARVMPIDVGIGTITMMVIVTSGVRPT